MPGDDERLFLRVVEAGSLKAAAEQIHADPSTVSRRIAGLEERLGVKLLQRSTRRSTPTDAGARYLAGLRQLVDQQDALEADISDTSDTPRGRLRVTAPLDFGDRFVVPVAEALQRSAPALEIDLVLGSSFLDLGAQGIDVAIRIGRMPDSSLISRKLGEVPRVLVGAPAYLDRRGRPESPEALADHDFVLYRRRTHDRPIEFVGPDGEAIAIPIKGRIAVNSITSICALVAAGHGLCFGALWSFEDALAAGEVESLLPDYLPQAYPLHALYAPSAYVPAKIRAFIDGMAEYVRQQPTLTAVG